MTPLRLARTLAAAVLLAAAPLSAQAQSVEPVAPSTPEAAAERPIKAVMFYSGVCGACRVLDPRINAVKGEFDGRAVEFVRFDQTFSLFRGGALDAQAETAEVEDVWARYKGGTGFMAIVDAATGAEIDIVIVRHSKDDIRAAIERALRAPTG